MTRTLPLALLLLSSCNPSAGEPDLRLSHSWARETVAGQKATAAYLRIANGGGGDRLVDVDTPAPAQASLHATSISNGLSRMRPLEGGLEIPAGETVALEPGGAHIMVENLAGPLAAGDTLQLTLRFERSGEQVIDVPMRTAAPELSHSAHGEIR